VRHGREERGIQPLGPDRQPLGMTARTEVAAFTREREQILVRARVAADARGGATGALYMISIYFLGD
jgi:hypothetical protein